MNKPIPYGKQFIDIKDKKSVLSSLSNELITTGPFVKNFEKQLKKRPSANFVGGWPVSKKCVQFMGMNEFQTSP